MNFAKICKNIFSFWLNASRWLLLVFICEFWDVFQNTSFKERLGGNCYFYVQLARFQPPDAVKNRSKKHFTGAFQVFYTRSRGSHSKGFIYLKSLKTVCEEVNLLQSCEMPTCKLTKKTLSHIVLHALRLHFLRIHHNYIFRRGLESLRAQFLSGSVSGK